MSTSYFLSQFPRHLAIVALGPMSGPNGSSPSGLMLDLRQLLWGACDKKQAMCLSCSIGLIYDPVHVMSGCVFLPRSGIDDGPRCTPDLDKLTAQSDELKLEIMTFLKSKYADFDAWLDKTCVLYKRWEQLNNQLTSTSTMVQNEVRKYMFL